MILSEKAVSEGPSFTASASTRAGVQQAMTSMRPSSVRGGHVVGQRHMAAPPLDAPALRLIPRVVPGNDAHCGIQNISAQKGRSYMAEVRGKLARLSSPPVTFDDACKTASYRG